MNSQISPGNLNSYGELTGLLLGAGASYDLGMPLLKELTHELKSWLTPDKLRALNRHWRRGGPGFGHPDIVIENLASVLARDDMHYENILGYLQMQSRRRLVEAQSYDGLYQFFSGIIYALLQERHLLNVGYIERNIRYLDGIKSFAEENAPLWIFSLNHDLIIECFAADVGIPIKSGFTEQTFRLPRWSPSGTQIGHLEAAVLTEGVLKKQGLRFFDRGQAGINLHKIHGSLDVFTFRDGRDVLKFLPDGEGIQGVLSSLRIVNQELRYVEPTWPGGVITAPNEIIYADESGEMQFLRRSHLAGAYKFDQRHYQVLPNEMLSYFRSNLNQLTTLVCIGYSFGDHHINQVIRDWLEFRCDRHLTIVDPRASQIPNEILHLAPQVDILPSDCTEFLDQVGGIERKPMDHAMRRFSAWKRENEPGADVKFQEFLHTEMSYCAENGVAWVQKLPMRDGNIDVEALDTTVEELSREMIQEVAIPSPAEIIEKFLEVERANRDSQR